jgi:hypothetical protein
MDMTGPRERAPVLPVRAVELSNLLTIIDLIYYSEKSLS